MRRLIKGLLAALLVGAMASVAVAEGQYRIVVNGKLLTPDVPPANIDGRLMVPLRAVSEALGVEVSYDSRTQTATINSTASPGGDLSEAQRQELVMLNEMRGEVHQITMLMLVISMGLGISRTDGILASSADLKNVQWDFMRSLIGEFQERLTAMEMPSGLQAVMSSEFQGSRISNMRQFADQLGRIAADLDQAKAADNKTGQDGLARALDVLQLDADDLGTAALTFDQAIQIRVNQILGAPTERSWLIP